MNTPGYNKNSVWLGILRLSAAGAALLLLLLGAIWLFRLAQTGSALPFGRLPQELAASVLAYSTITSLLALIPGILTALYLAAYAGDKIRMAAEGLLRFLSGLPMLFLGLPFLQSSTTEWLAGPTPGSITAGLILAFPAISFHVARIIRRLPSSLGQVAATLGVSRAYAVSTMLIPMAAPSVLLATLFLALRIAVEYLCIALFFGYQIPGTPTASILQAPAIVAAAILSATLLKGISETVLRIMHNAGK